MKWLILAGMLAGADPGPTNLAAPVRLMAGGQPINVDIGHAAPFVADLHGDGSRVLLVGQFGEGKLRVYPNVGSKHEPKFDKFEWLKTGATVATVPTG
jgi:hypothetical protein